MSFCTEATQARARKNHRCYWCSETIFKGHIHMRWAFADGGQMFTTRMHPECFNASKSYHYTGDEIPEGENPRGCDCGFDKDCSCSDHIEPIADYVRTQRDWSLTTFGPGKRTEGILKHIEKELAEVRQKPDDIYEWIDIAILALDGAWRAGYTARDIARALQTKQEINISRVWPKPGPEDQPTEHVRDAV